MERERGGGGHVPSPSEIKKKRGDLTQKEASTLVYTCDRTWRHYELGKARMHPSMWELFLLKALDKDK